MTIKTGSGASLARLLFQGSFDAILIIDPDTRQVVDANRAARLALKYTLQELRGKPASAVFLADGAARSALFSAPSRANDLRNIDCRLLRKDGSQLHAEVRALPFTEGDQALNALLIRDLSEPDQREADYQALVSNIPGMAFQAHRDLEGRFSLPFVSAHSAMLLGVKPQALQKNPARFATLVLPEDRPSYLESLADANGCHLTFNWEGRIRIKAWKDTKWVSIRAMRRETPSGTVWDGIMLNITQSKLAKAEIEQSKEQLRHLTRHIQEVKETERKRIAQEVHDDLGGNLTAIKIGIAWLTRHLEIGPDKTAERLAYLNDITDGALDAVHRIASDLRPPALDFGIVSAIRWQAAQVCRMVGIDCRFFTSRKEIALKPDASITVFRIAQEALTNIAKHAGATSAEVRLSQRNGQLRLTVADNGVGPQFVKRKTTSRTFGILGMSERAAAMGGKVTVEPNPGGGTLVSLEIPAAMPGSKPAPGSITRKRT